MKRFTGFVPGSDFVRSAELVGAHPAFDRLRIIYNDFSAVDGHSIDYTAYRRVAICRLGSVWTNPNYRVAFIARGDMADLLSRAIEGADPPEAVYHPVVVGSLEEARDWFAHQPTLDRLRGHPGRLAAPRLAGA